MKALRPWLLALLVLIVLVPPLRAHSTPEMNAVHLALLEWAKVVTDGDSATMAGWVRGGVEVEPKMVQEVAMIAAGMPVQSVDLEHALHEDLDSGRVRVSPVVLRSQVTRARWAWSLELARRDAEDVPAYQVVAIRRAELPAEMIGLLPEQRPTRTVRVRVRDAATGRLVASRVHIGDADGEYWPPRGHEKNIAVGWREDVGGDVLLRGRTWAYVPGELDVDLEAGSYEIEAARGPEYKMTKASFEVPAEGELPRPEIVLERWIDLAAEGWYSGDTHTHFLRPGSGIREARGEDLRVLNILATKWTELVTDVEEFSGAPHVLSDGENVVYYNEECRHAFLGHTIFLDLRELVYPLTWGGPMEGVPGGSDYPPMATQTDRAHAQGAFVSWAHFPFPKGEVAIDLALGKVDSIDLMTFGDPFADVMPFPGMPPAAKTWYRFLGCGLKLPAAGGTDKMWNTQVAGSVRTYVRVDGGFSYKGWIEGLRAGRSFVTDGPALFLTAAGHGLGETIAASPGEKIPVRAELRSLRPVEWIEILHGGEVVARLDNKDARRELVLEAEVEAGASSWIAARAYSSQLLPFQAMEAVGAMGIPIAAHTSPIYVEVEGRPARCAEEDAELFIAWCDEAIAWAKDVAHFHDDGERREMVALFEQAKAFYLRHLESP